MHFSGGPGRHLERSPASLPAKAIAYWTLLYGTYANWFVTRSLRFRYRGPSPITAVGIRAALAGDSDHGRLYERWRRDVASSVLILWGLRARSLR